MIMDNLTRIKEITQLKEFINLELDVDSFAQVNSRIYILDEKINSYIKNRPRQSHKGTYGHAIIFAGCYGKMGAAALGAKVEAGTGYFKTSWAPEAIVPEMGNVSVTRKTNGVSWGAMYWQYFEDLDKITTHETPLKLNKKLFLVENTASGPVMKPITATTALKPGDKVRVRIELRSDRDMEYVHMKDMRAAGFEPVNVFSRYKWQDGLGYYESTKDAATNFFMDYLPKGTYVFEYDLRVSHFGDFSNGIATIQCMYAPEFTSHSEGIRVNVAEKGE